MAASMQPGRTNYFFAKIRNYWHRFSHLNSFSDAMNVDLINIDFPES